MRGKFHITIILLSLLGFVFTTCKKYPEDRGLQLKTVKDRIDGEWKIDRIEINDVDMTYQYNDSLQPMAITDFYFWFNFSLYFNNENVDIIAINKSSKDARAAANEADVGAIDLYLENKKREIGFSSGFEKIPVKDPNSLRFLTQRVFNFKPLVRAAWLIKSLTKKIMIIEKNVDNNKYRIYFRNTRKK